MAEQTVCDNCGEAPLRPATGFYQITVKKILKDKDGARTQSESEYDVCGGCMQAIRKAAPEIK